MIVITGLDGSGKSTLLTRLENELADKIQVLRVPTIEAEKFRSDDALYKTCKLVNFLGEKGDLEKMPSLKIIAMFGSVLLFEELHAFLIKSEPKTVFCERHPLIDTSIYARAYSKVMNPDLLDLETAHAIEASYGIELAGLMQRVNGEIPIAGKGMCYDLLEFLSQWFSDEQNFGIDRLQHLFSINKPEKIYFLDAPAEVLIKRLGNRETKEYHETESALEKMRTTYLNFLPTIGVPFQCVNAVDMTEANRLVEELKEMLG